MVLGGSGEETGVATSVAVQYAAAAHVGSEVHFTARVLKRGSRLVVVKVELCSANGKLLATGIVTKSLRGATRAK